MSGQNTLYSKLAILISSLSLVVASLGLLNSRSATKMNRETHEGRKRLLLSGQLADKGSTLILKSENDDCSLKGGTLVFPGVLECSGAPIKANGSVSIDDVRFGLTEWIKEECRNQSIEDWVRKHPETDKRIPVLVYATYVPRVTNREATSIALYFLSYHVEIDRSGRGAAVPAVRFSHFGSGSSSRDGEVPVDVRVDTSLTTLLNAWGSHSSQTDN